RRLVGSGPSTLKFAREDGEEHLQPYFASVERTDLDGVLTFADRAAVADYVDASIAMSPYAANLPEEIPLPFEARRGSSVVDARVGDVQDMPFDDASFDTVVAAWMLYHVTDIDRGLAEIRRVLEPGGRFIANTNARGHNRELFELIGYPLERRATVFNAENG